MSFKRVLRITRHLQEAKAKEQTQVVVASTTTPAASRDPLKELFSRITEDVRPKLSFSSAMRFTKRKVTVTYVDRRITPPIFQVIPVEEKPKKPTSFLKRKYESYTESSSKRIKFEPELLVDDRYHNWNQST